MLTENNSLPMTEHFIFLFSFLFFRLIPLFYLLIKFTEYRKQIDRLTIFIQINYNSINQFIYFLFFYLLHTKIVRHKCIHLCWLINRLKAFDYTKS